MLALPAHFFVSIPEERQAKNRRRKRQNASAAFSYVREREWRRWKQSTLHSHTILKSRYCPELALNFTTGYKTKPKKCFTKNNNENRTRFVKCPSLSPLEEAAEESRERGRLKRGVFLSFYDCMTKDKDRCMKLPWLLCDSYYFSLLRNKEKKRRERETKVRLTT